MNNKYVSLILTLTAIMPAMYAHAECGDGCNQTLDDMAAPLTHPTSFEDPRPYTEIRPIYIYHKLDDEFVTGGGAANVYALQLRYAVDERWGIIATKDGYVDLNTDEVLADENGFADLSVGAKYAFYRDDVSRDIATIGLRYEVPLGEKEVFQGQADGAFNPFLSAATGLGPINIMVGTGFRLAVDSEDSSFYDLDLHFDTKIGAFHPLVEFNVYHVLDGGKRLPIADEGEDFFNFGASEASGKTLVAAAIGGRFDLTDSITWGAGYQFPLSSGAGSNTLAYRITTDLIFYF
jgi:hypothetical protein